MKKHLLDHPDRYMSYALPPIVLMLIWAFGVWVFPDLAVSQIIQKFEEVILGAAIAGLGYALAIMREVHRFQDEASKWSLARLPFSDKVVDLEHYKIFKPKKGKSHEEGE